MKRTCICTLSFDAIGATVSKLAAACALDLAYVMLLLTLVEAAKASCKTLKTPTDELTSSLISVLSYRKYKICVLHRCLVQNHLIATMKQCIQDYMFLWVPVNLWHLDGAPGYLLVYWVNPTYDCIAPVPAHLKLRSSITQMLVNNTQDTSNQLVCQLKTCGITRQFMPNSFSPQLTLKSVFIPFSFGLSRDEQDYGTEGQKLQDTLCQLKTCIIATDQVPTPFAQLAYGLPAISVSSANVLVNEDSSDEKSSSRGALFSWLKSFKLLTKSRNINFEKFLPPSNRFKLAFISIILITFLLLSTITCARFITNPKKHSRQTSVFIIVICSLQLAEAMPYNSRMEILNLGTREATNGTSVIPLKGSPNTGYCVMIGIGSESKQEFCVLLDTGSANLAIAGMQHPDIESQFHPEELYLAAMEKISFTTVIYNLDRGLGRSSSSFRDLGKTVKVSYTAGSWTGRLAKDFISIGGSKTVESFLVVIESAEDFYIKDADWVGIMGLAYSNLAKPDSSVTPFWEGFQAATGKADIFSFQFCPPLDVPLLDITEPKGGVMVLGGIDQTLYCGPIFYTSLVQQKFYNVLVTNITVGETVISLDCGEFNNDQSIVDSGTTDVFLPEKVFTEVKKAFIDNFKDDLPLDVPEEFWNGGYKLAWAVDDKHSIYSAFPTFYISFATHDNASLEFSLAVTPQIYLRQIEGTSEEQASTNCFPECDFFTFGIKQRQQGTVIGGNIMLGFYTIFDRENKRIGFANSTCKYQDDRGGLPHIVGPYRREPTDCECTDCKQGQGYWEITTYICGAIVIPLAIMSVIFAVFRRMKHLRCNSRGVSISTCKKKCCGDCCNNSKLPTQETDTLLEGATEEATEEVCNLGSPTPETDDQKDHADKHPLLVEKDKPEELEEAAQHSLKNKLVSSDADCQEHNRTSAGVDLMMRNMSQQPHTAGVSSTRISNTDSYGTVNMPMEETEHSCTSATVYTCKGKNFLKSNSESNYDAENEILNTSMHLENELVAQKRKEYTPLPVSDSDECRQPQLSVCMPQIVTVEETTPSTDCGSMFVHPKPTHSNKPEYLTRQVLMERQASGPLTRQVLMERQASGPHEHNPERYGRQVSYNCSLAADSGDLCTQTSCEES